VRRLLVLRLRRLRMSCEHELAAREEVVGLKVEDEL
jgi:hypothetical protein